jgi:Predicted amidohydrolase
MKLDFLIQNGRVVDPSRGFDAIRDIGVRDGEIVDAAGREGIEPLFVFDASDLLVLPGLIDFHAHVFFGGSDLALSPDLFTLPMGVTTVVDAGTAGTANLAALRSCCSHAQVRMKYQVNLSPAGLATRLHDEEIDPARWDRARLKRICLENDENLVGLKIRLSREIVGEFGVEPLVEAVRLSNEIRAHAPGDPCLERATRIVVHTTDPPAHIAQVAGLLRKDDVFVHAYQGVGMNIIEDGTVHPSIREARGRGVLFDAANGKGHFSFAVAEAAIADGFPPDIISTDLTPVSNVKHAIGLPHLMSRYLMMGLDLHDIVTATTATPARLLGMSERIGTLRPGACADVSIFSLRRGEIVFTDTSGAQRTGDRFFMPELVLSAGRIAFRQMDRRID